MLELSCLLFWTITQDGRVNALYSTPSIYTDAKYAANELWPLKTNDFFPYAFFILYTQYGLVSFLFCALGYDCISSSRYADNPNAYWTGYFTSRPALKRYVRMMSGYYLVLFTSFFHYMLGFGFPNGIHKFLGHLLGRGLIVKYSTVFRQLDSWSSLKGDIAQVSQQIV
jgi:hypothetical protein